MKVLTMFQKLKELNSLAHQKNQVLPFRLMIAAIICSGISSGILITGLVNAAFFQAGTYWNSTVLHTSLLVQVFFSIMAIVTCYWRNRVR